MRLSIFICLFIYTAIFAQTKWEKVDMSFPGNNSLLYIANVNFVTKNTGWLSTNSYDSVGKTSAVLFETQNGGKNWEAKKEFKNLVFTGTSFNLDTNYVWFLGMGSNLLFTKNMGLTWDTSTAFYDNARALYFFDEKNGIVMRNYYPYFTSDGGYTWKKGSDSSNIIYPSEMFFVNENVGWAVSFGHPYATDVGSVYYTTNGGKTWSFQVLITYMLHGVYFTDPLNGFAVGTNVKSAPGGIRTTDGGKNWTSFTNYNPVFKGGPLTSIRFLDKNYGWICGQGQIYYTSNGGETWSLQSNEYKTYFQNLIILKKEKTAYVFGRNADNKTFTLLRADLSNLTTVAEDKKITREDFFLSDNFPNPFNPSTVITYKVPEYSKVELKVYNLLGKEVMMLVYKEQPAGEYKTELNANGLPSGVYFYQLRTGKFIQTKKMLLLR